MEGKNAKRENELRRFAGLLKLVGDRNRLRILCLLFGQKKICVSAVASRAGLSVADASHHLRSLARYGLVQAKREGKQVCYVPAAKQNEFLSDLKRLICRRKLNIK